jgi:hypothetical protein
MVEYVIWGFPPGETDRVYGRQVLNTRARSRAEADDIVTILARDHGCTDMCIQVLDGSIPDFAATVNV